MQWIGWNYRISHMSPKCTSSWIYANKIMERFSLEDVNQWISTSVKRRVKDRFPSNPISLVVEFHCQLSPTNIYPSATSTTNKVKWKHILTESRKEGEFYPLHLHTSQSVCLQHAKLPCPNVSHQRPFKSLVSFHCHITTIFTPYYYYAKLLKQCHCRINSGECFS